MEEGGGIRGLDTEGEFDEVGASVAKKELVFVLRWYYLGEGRTNKVLRTR